ncbi:MAG: TetR/AcrR family transcriptional regulator [Treponema sp.]|jgi:AcrR family transcriptional regulator|nr:TetR/AcrR family transcriptional regulator [Treponema sp.]
MPRALTEQEKCRLCQRLLDKGRDIVFGIGIKKISVDDITKAASMAKGSFYHHFESKEKYLYELIMDIHKQIFEQAQKYIETVNSLREKTQLKQYISGFLNNLFHMPQMKFLIKNCNDINDLIDAMPESEKKGKSIIDADLFEKLINMTGVDTKKLKSGVMHNYMHTLFMIMDCDLMMEDDLDETFELIMDSFISYLINGGVAAGDIK